MFLDKEVKKYFKITRFFGYIVDRFDGMSADIISMPGWALSFTTLRKANLAAAE